ncbi:ubiquinol-cytochrome c reductase iron-sulfur subunit [uncultured Umboniibacter sp.]|uniref:ubiquinol-cytochrome c reductase iron-sulfur subunit n=1 Tax=uncultured Umboniibacter sp. TaxID=1798917 RepID=UPI002617ABEB|nr:ubiquinol-cytochrome c reductase iron-sulfur subunit [uncultured Umboniibacter sp.]
MSDDGVNTARRKFLIGATGAVGAVGAVGAAVPFVGSWAPSAKAKAAGAPARVNISKLAPGEMMVGEWRGKPIYVVRRTPEVLEDLYKMDGELRDPESVEPMQPEYAQNHYRSIKDEYLVLIGICTHLGCAPQYRPEVGAADLGGDQWFGGFYCPCHGSKFDLAGRVLKGVPAPVNLEVPPYKFETDGLLIIGVDEETA